MKNTFYHQNFPYTTKNKFLSTFDIKSTYRNTLSFHERCKWDKRGIKTTDLRNKEKFRKVKKRKNT